ncbi:hypothetical protein DaDZ19_32830 [Dickeya ananatis]
MRVIMMVLGGTLLLSGCSLDPHYQRPSAPVPAAWPQGASYPATAQAHPPAEDIPWREVMVDDKLRQVVEMALSDNRDLRKAIADVEAARAQLGEQRATLLPTINAGIDGDRSRSLISGSDSTVLSSSYGASLSTSAFTLDLFGKNRSLTGAAREAYLSSAATATSTRLTLIADTATAWVALATARSNLTLARQTMESAGQSLAVTRSRLRNGVASAVDVAQAETVYQQARADVASALTTEAQDKKCARFVSRTARAGDATAGRCGIVVAGGEAGRRRYFVCRVVAPSGCTGRGTYAEIGQCQYWRGPCGVFPQYYADCQQRFE